MIAALLTFLTWLLLASAVPSGPGQPPVWPNAAAADDRGGGWDPNGITGASTNEPSADSDAKSNWDPNG